MKFPDRFYDAMSPYFDAYAEGVAAAMQSVSREQMQKAVTVLEEAIKRGATIYACGNGGSAAIANHLVCDCVKGAQTDTDLRPKIHSLSANIEILTAIANDFAYDQVFSYPLATFAQKGDVLIAISSSGRSPNIVKAIRWARANGVTAIAMTGFDGGEALAEADIPLHVAAENYGIVEDVHQSLMHVLAQYLRQHNMHESLHPTRKF